MSGLMFRLRKGSKVSVQALAAVLVFLWIAASIQPVQAQSLAEDYRKQWFRATAERILEQRGLRATPMPPDHLPSISDSIRWRHEWRHRLEERALRAPLIMVRSIRAVRRLERPVYEDRFIGIRRTYVGNGRQTPIDTMQTAELRARLQHAYGQPTRSLPDLYDESRKAVEEYIQFEYWLIVNDSIPLIVMDVDGPFDRGLVLATEAGSRHLLPDIKRGFAWDLFRIRERDRYADYYFNEVERAWYVTGFDGERFVLKRIRTPDLRHGRPWVGLLR